MASFGRDSWWEEFPDRERVRTLSFCYWQTLRLWTSPFMHVGLSFLIHKIREMVPLSRSENMILVFTQLGREMHPDSCLWKSSLQAVLPPEGWQAQGCPLPCSVLWEPPAEPPDGPGPPSPSERGPAHRRGPALWARGHTPPTFSPWELWSSLYAQPP